MTILLTFSPQQLNVHFQGRFVGWYPTSSDLERNLPHSFGYNTPQKIAHLEIIFLEIDGKSVENSAHADAAFFRNLLAANWLHLQVLKGSPKADSNYI